MRFILFRDSASASAEYNLRKAGTFFSVHFILITFSIVAVMYLQNEIMLFSKQWKTVKRRGTLFYCFKLVYSFFLSLWIPKKNLIGWNVKDLPLLRVPCKCWLIAVADISLRGNFVPDLDVVIWTTNKKNRMGNTQKKTWEIYNWIDFW